MSCSFLSAVCVTGVFCKTEVVEDIDMNIM